MMPRASYARMLTRRYSRFGTDATFISPATRQPATLRIVDLTKASIAGHDFVQVQTMTPTVTARADDIAALGFEPSDLVGVTITYYGTAWVVATYGQHPGTFDDTLDQFYFTLEEQTR